MLMLSTTISLSAKVLEEVKARVERRVIENNVQVKNDTQTQTTEWHQDKTKDKEDKTIKNYKVIYSIFFKYWITIIVIILAVFIFFILIKKEIKLDINNE